MIVENIAVDAKEQTGPIIFNLFLRLLPRLKIPLRGSKEDQELRAKFHFDEHVIDAECIASLIEKLLLLSSVSVSSSNIGLTTDEVKFLTLSKPDTWDPKQPDGLDLQQTKVAALKFVSSGAFKDEERFLPSLIASADPDSRINSIGNELIKRSTVSVEDKAVVESLYRLYMLNRPPLRIKILQMLAKSHLATNYVEKIKSVMTTTLTFDGEQAAGRHGLESNKLRKALFSFINWVSRMASKDTLETLSPWTVKWIGEFFEDEGWPNPSSFSPDSMELRSLAYETLGTMAAAVPSTVVEPDLGLVRWLFRALAEERSPHAVFMSIEAALASILTAFTSKASGSSTDLDLPGNVDPKVLEQLRTLLLEVVTQPLDEDVIHSARFVAIRWANRCLQYDDVVARWIDVDALAPRKREKRDIAEEGRRGLVSNSLKSISSWTILKLESFRRSAPTSVLCGTLVPDSKVPG